MKRLLLLSIASLLATAQQAQAITLPDNSTANCSQTGGTNPLTCVRINNTSNSGGAVGIWGVSGGGFGYGVVGDTNAGTGVHGTATGTGIGVHGDANTGDGVYGSSSAATGVHGASTAGNSTGTGVLGTSPLGTGVSGSSTSGAGVKGTSSTNNGLIGINSVTDHSASAVSAVCGGTSGLSYWGNGGILLNGSFAEKAGGGSWSAPSDMRIKRDVKTFSPGLAELLRVRSVSFKYNGLGGTENDNQEYVGVIAQELEKVLPGMVSSRTGKLRKGDARETEIKRVDPSAFSYVLINAVQEQQKIIQRQEARLATLEQNQPPMRSSILPLDGLGVLPWGLIGLASLVFAIRRRKERQR